MNITTPPQVKIMVAQMEVFPGDIEKNTKRILSILDSARGVADIVVFPELCVSGYLLGDRFEYVDFIEAIEEANTRIKEYSQGLVVVWGSVVADKDRIGEDGRMRKYNAALIAQNGAWVSNGVLEGFMPKNNLPKYRIFDDARHFYPAYKRAKEMGISEESFFNHFTVTIQGHVYKLALAVCEDMWEDEYNIKLSQLYRTKQVDLLIDISASPWTCGKWHAREAMLTKRVRDVSAPVLYVNAIGLQNNAKNFVWFDGCSVLVAKDGTFVYRAEANKETQDILDMQALLQKPKAHTLPRKERIEELYGGLASALFRFYAPFRTIVVGLSGGIDSALTLALLYDVFPQTTFPGKILAVNMPSKFNSQTTQSLAKKMADTLHIPYRVVPIQDMVDSHMATLRASGFDTLKQLTVENIQARTRGHVLSTIAQHEGGVFTNNGNKTEVSLNYFTLYGDSAGAASFLGDLWKGEVYELARYINTKYGREIIPEGILSVVPSAELSENQNVDEGKGDPIYYEYHDKLLRAFVEKRMSITEALEAYEQATLETAIGCAPGTIAKYFRTDEEFIKNLEWAWIALNTEFKRVQLPPVFLVSRRAFGFDRRDTIALPFFGEQYKEVKKRTLSTGVLTSKTT
jgi:NAD+ synthase (glutamine-hydrolysing)